MSSKIERIEVFNDTERWIRSNRTLSDAVEKSTNDTRLYMEEEYPPELSIERQWGTTINVSRMKTFEAVFALKKDDSKSRIGVHNFASATNPGGGVTHGSSAQEECLCRCSTLYNVLNRPMLYHRFYEFHRNRHDAHYTDACIFTPGILIIKTDEDIPQRLDEDKWENVDVLTCAAPNLRVNPSIPYNASSGNRIMLTKDELLNLHIKRARHMLAIAAAHGDDTLVLGAFGCGAFRNDPKIVAKAYKKVLEEFYDRFHHIEFAVYCGTSNTENYDAFVKEFG